MPMRDHQHPASSRRSAATRSNNNPASSSSSLANNSTTSQPHRALPKSPNSITRSNNNNNSSSASSSSSSSNTGLWLADESDSDWDCGVGNLVIDLDSDQGRGDSEGAPSLCLTAPNTMSSPHKASPPGKSEHQATVNKGLKMKIKRTSGGSKQAGGAAPGSSSGAKSTDSQHEIVKSEHKSSAVNSSANGEGSGSAMPSPADKLKTSGTDKDRKGRSVHKKERKDKGRGLDSHSANGPAGVQAMSVAVGGSSGSSLVTPCSSTSGASHQHCASNSAGPSATMVNSGPFAIKKELPAHDPYEFNAKVEDRIGFPVTKKIKVEKTETATSPMMPPPQDGPIPGPSAPGASGASGASAGASADTQDKAVATQHVGVVTDPDCLGPCEPGTSVTLEGIVWHETDNGVLVVNVTWRGKTYVGTLLDATKHDWAPPRFSSDSPTSDIDSRTPKGRGKRGRGGTTPKTEAVGDRRLRNRRSFPAPPSPARSESSVGKRRAAQAAEAEREASNGDGPMAPKRSRSSSRSTPTRSSTNGRDSPNWIECPEPNCFKKYKHLNGLKYHQTKAHPPAEESENSSKSKSQKDSTAMETDNISELPRPSNHGRGHSSKGSKKPHTVTSATMNMDTQDKDHTVAVAPLKDNGSNSSSQNTSSDPQASVMTSTSIKDLKTTTTSSKANNFQPSDRPHSDSTTDNKKANDVKHPMKASPLPAAAANFPQVRSDNKNRNSTNTGSTNTAQVFQLAAAPIACLGGTMTVVTQSTPANQVAVTGGTTVVQATTTQIPVGTATMPTMPVTVVPTLSSPEADKSKKMKPADKMDKNKVKPSLNARPIVPAPVVTSTQTLQTSGATLTQVAHMTATTQLKAIQPRPTIMGEPTTVNPALSSLKDMKDKKCKKKKDKKDKDRPKESASHAAKGVTVTVASTVMPATVTMSSEGTSTSVTQADNKHVPSLVVPQCMDTSSTSVIKTLPNTTPSTSVSSTAKLGGTDLMYAGSVQKQQQQQQQQHQQQQQQQHQQQQQQQHKPPELLKVPEILQKPPELQKQPSLSSYPDKLETSMASQTTRPPSSLSLNSPVQGGDRERSSDVHSPAYSDISDANDTAPTLENEAEQKPLQDKGGDSMNAQKNRPQEPGMTQGFPMFESAGQPPYLIPAVSHPGLPNHGRESQPGTPDSHASLPKSGDKSSPYNPKNEPMKESPHPHADYPVPPQYQNYARLTSAYGYAIDPAYHMHLMATDPQYRAQHERVRSEQERAQREEEHKNDPDKTKSPDQERKSGEENKAVDVSGGGKPSEKSAPPASASTASATAAAAGKDYKNALPKPPSLVSDKEREEQRRREMVSEQSLLEKKNENHQILKENLELKSQMESRARYEGYDPKVMNARQQADMQMYYMYMAQQQHSQNQPQAPHPHAQHPQGQSTPRKAPETITASPKDSSGDQQLMQQQQQQQQQQQHPPPSEPNKPLDLESKHRSVSREGRPEIKRVEDKLVKSESKTPSPRPSPRPSSRDSRSTPSRPRDLPPSSAAGGVPCMPSPYAPYFHPGYLQAGMPPGFPGQMPMDPRHPAAQLSVDPRQLAMDPRQLATVDPRQLATVDPRQLATVDPRQLATVDPRQLATVDPRQLATVDPRQLATVDPRQLATVDPRQLATVDPRQLATVDPRQLATVDPRHAAMLQGMNPAMLGYAPNSFLYHSQMRYPDGPPHIESEKAAGLLSSPGAMGGAPESKALDLLQQHAQQYYSGTHKIHELKDAARQSAPSPSKPPPATTPREKSQVSPSGSSTGKDSDKGGSPPPQRHVHTHHHTHVVGGSTYPIYGSYGGK